MDNKDQEPKRSKTWVDYFLTGVIIFCGVMIAMIVSREVMSSNKIMNASDAALNQISLEEVSANEQASVSYDYREIKPIKASDIERVLSEGNIYDLPIIGGLMMPDLDIHLPIIKGVSELGMYTGATTLLPNQEMGKGNYPLSSHRSLYNGILFGPLNKAEVGMAIYVSDLDKVYHYEVTSSEVVEPDAMEVLDESDVAEVTLITCTLDMSERIIVKGELIESYPLSEAPVEVQEGFNTTATNEWERQAASE